MSTNFGSAMEGFYRGYGFMNNLQQQKLQNERRARLDEQAEEWQRARLAGLEFDQNLRGERFTHDKSRAGVRDTQWTKDFDLREANQGVDQKIRQRGLELREDEARRSGRNSDLAYKQALEQETRRKNAEVAVMLENILTAEDGTRLSDDQITQAHLDQMAPLLNNIEGLRLFGAVNPDVDPKNPFAGALLIPAEKEGDKPRVGFRLRMKDGSIEDMTVDRKSKTDADVLVPTLSMIRRAVVSELDPAGTAKRLESRRKQKTEREQTTFETDEKIRLEEAKAGEKTSMVRRVNGKPVTEADLSREYINEYGRPDPNNPLQKILRADAPSFQKWKDDQVAPEYRVGRASGLDLSDKDYQALAGKELQDERKWYVPFDGPSSTDIGARAAELKRKDARRAPAPTGRTRGQTAGGAPAAAIELLRQNPQYADQFKAKYGYLPEGF